MLRGLVENFYAGEADAGVVFDTSRLWSARTSRWVVVP